MLIRKVTTGLLALLSACIALMVVVLAYPVVYSKRIYPGVSVGDVALGGLTVEEATPLLIDRLPDPNTRAIELQAGERSWQLSWAETGRGYNYAATATAAYRVGRDGPRGEQALSPWRIRLQGRSIDPHVVPASAAQVRARLEELASLIHAPPTGAQLRISAEGVTSIPGEPGRALDVQTSSTRVLQAITEGATEVELAMVDLPRPLAEAEPAVTLAQSLLAEPFTLVADDPLTDYINEFQAAPKQLATWLDAVAAGEKMLLPFDKRAVRDWLVEVVSQLGPERILDGDETLTRTLAALTAGGHQARSVIRHPEGTHVVQPRDTLSNIAYHHGFPQWRLQEENPEVEPDELPMGRELSTPSIDVLFPEPLVPGKRIEIDLPEQRLRAYIAVYHEGPQFANGIHELPITSGGHRLWAGYPGWPASHGCIILDVGDPEKLYDWAPVGTLMRIEGVALGTPTV
ncbi:MAG: peptidoglycan binding domain-containing protein, partial [Anaerolineae bacterium]